MLQMTNILEDAGTKNLCGQQSSVLEIFNRIGPRVILFNIAERSHVNEGEKETIVGS